MKFKASSRIAAPVAIATGFVALWLLTALPALGQEFFPPESFTPTETTLPNDKLNFEDDSQESCCSKDYTPDGKPIARNSSENGSNVVTNSAEIRRTDFERSNPRYVENSTPSHLISCDRFADFPENASIFNQFPMANAQPTRGNLPIVSYSTNVSIRVGADYFSDPKSRNTSDFHIETAGGGGLVRLQDVNSYSVCMARGSNIAMVANTDNGSILSYNGNDKIYLAGNNTNMFTRTGSGEDIIELHLTRSNEATGNYQAYNIYKTALSGGSGQDELILRNAPAGTKWCHIGGYKLYGEYFYVVEIALPPAVTEGPRRQRISIGSSIESVSIKGKKYVLQDFLTHGSPVDTVAQSIPLDAPLPR
jgi:hypothetical protein